MCCHLALELKLNKFLSNNVRMSTASRLLKCVAYCAITIVTIAHTAETFAVVRTWQIMIMINSDRFPVFTGLYFGIELAHNYLHGRADRSLVLASNGQVAALNDWAYCQ